MLRRPSSEEPWAARPRALADPLEQRQVFGPATSMGFA